MMLGTPNKGSLAVVLAGVLVVMGLWGAVGTGDAARAEALWEHAVTTAGDDLQAPVYIDAARELAQLRPWHRGWSEARQRLAHIERARLDAARVH